MPISWVQVTIVPYVPGELHKKEDIDIPLNNEPILKGCCVSTESSGEKYAEGL